MSETGTDAGAVAALEGSYPVLPAERTWGGLALFGVSASTAIATWCFLIGGYVGYYLGAVDGTIIMIAGSLVGIALIVLSCMPASTKYGVDSIVGTKPQLGTRGVYLSLFLMYASVIGWNCLLMILLGRAGAEILIATDVIGEGGRQTVEILFGVGALVVVWAALRRGPESLKNVGPIIAISVMILAIVILIALVAELGWSAIFNAEPGFASDSRLWNVTTGFEIMVAVALSWWPYTGGMVRLVPSARRAMWPVVLGLGIPVALVSVIGLWSALAIPDSFGDPTNFLVDVGGLALGIPALLFIILANVGTAMVGAYVSAVGIKQIPAVQRKMPWNATTALPLLPVAIVVIVFPTWVYDHIGTFLAFMGVFFAPVCGVQIVDYFFLRKQRLDVRGLYTSGAGSRYHYWAGINPAGVLAIAAGFGTYLYLLDPVNYTSRAPYEYVSASLPAALVAGLIYLAITKLVVIPLGRGGYDDSPDGTEAARDAKQVPVHAMQAGEGAS